jgi:hypothetical protein
MRRALLVGFLLSSLLYLPTPASAARWYPSGLITNPTTSQVIVTTGAFSVDLYRSLCVYVAASAVAGFRYQLVDVDGTTILKEQAFPVAANSTTTFCPFMEAGLGGVFMATGQQLRVIMLAAVTGQVSASLFIPQEFD